MITSFDMFRDIGFRTKVEDDLMIRYFFADSAGSQVAFNKKKKEVRIGCNVEWNENLDNAINVQKRELGWKNEI